MVDDWTDLEIDLIVADYFAMLENELAGKPFNKAACNRHLQAQISRGRGSIEFKHQNISAVMLGLGQPWINGYKPKANFQIALVDGVMRWLEKNENWLSSIPRVQSDLANRFAEARSLWIGPPPTHRNEPPPIDPEIMAAMAQKFDVAARDQRNRALGRAGEELVLEHERRSLRQAGQNQLAEQVRWTSEEDGDGFGFDVLSYEPDGRERLLEVKTTNGWERTPFHVSRNELKVAQDRRDNWHLIRLWDFARSPKAFLLRPPLENHAEFTATSFLAKLH